MAKYVCNKNGINGTNGLPHYGLKYENIAIVTLQKILIFMGDLSRYRTKQLQSNDFSEAHKYYYEAFTLIPTNGVPFNKLGVLCIQTRNKFDAIYFQMRGLMAINSVYIAKERLTIIYDEIRKKYEETELSSSPIHQYKENTMPTNRKEIWVYPNGVRRLHRAIISKTSKVTLSQENRLNILSTEELLRRFLSTFIYINGKFYNGVDMDSIEAFERKLLVQLSILLKRSPLVISRSKLLKVVALNIFVIEHNKNKKAAGREIRYHAFNFANQIFGSIVNRANQLLIDYIETGQAFEKNNFTDLNTLLQYIKIYTDWMSLNIDLWEPIRNENIVIDSWFELESLFKTLYHLQKHEMTKHENVVVEEVILDENNFLVGYIPIGSKQTQYYKVNDTPQETQFYARIMIISQFRSIFEKHDNLLKLPEDLSFDTEADIDDAAELGFKSLSSDEDDATDSDNNENVGINISKQTEHMTRLTKLDTKKNGHVQNGCKNLDELLNFVNKTYIIEVRPKFLLLDTNCFIDCLKDFVTLISNHNRFILIVPLTVIKELDGLSKGIKREMDKNIKRDRLQHYDDVTTAAKKSLEFLKAPKCNVKFVTTKGSFIHSSLFGLVEEENISNDDKILASALSLCKNMSIEKTKRNNSLIRTELVVITTDRNLRVKALARNLAVSGLSEFLLWINGCST
ncbi:telomerase-binding protein EST1A-like [Teleopsis dalmanni]|uniref:telomerase-binding protein EST1A-like n=1 Tax=Teleopsis dalmanni TaxID=139649 RepID=UPI0018CD0223|nr:telomerase-binding protein EST1A-like [Teleopsis dalmanni]